MMFATCAHPGCTNQVPYDPVEDAYRPRYCEHHLHILCTARHYDVDDVESPFWIKVKEPVEKPDKQITLV